LFVGIEAARGAAPCFIVQHQLAFRQGLPASRMQPNKDFGSGNRSRLISWSPVLKKSLPPIPTSRYSVREARDHRTASPAMMKLNTIEGGWKAHPGDGQTLREAGHAHRTGEKRANILGLPLCWWSLSPVWMFWRAQQKN
jgi:hypothetical protein